MMTDNRKIDNIFFENVLPLFRTNFSGQETETNAKGRRNLVIEIPDEEFARQLLDDGWNIKIGKENKDGSKVYPPHMKINVNYPEDYPNLWPKIMMEQAGNKEYLNEETINLLDENEITNIKNLEVSGRYCIVNGKEYITAYVRKMRVEVAPDFFCD